MYTVSSTPSSDYQLRESFILTIQFPRTACSRWSSSLKILQDFFRVPVDLNRKTVFFPLNCHPFVGSFDSFKCYSNRWHTARTWVVQLPQTATSTEIMLLMSTFSSSATLFCFDFERKVTKSSCYVKPLL